MLQKQAQRDEILLAAGELGDVLRDGVVEVDFSLVVQNHQRRRGTDDFRERSKIVDTLRWIDGRAFVRPVEAAKAALPNGSSLSSNDDSGARVASGLDAAHNDMIDFCESGGRHANRARRLDRQAVADAPTRATGGESQCREQQSNQHYDSPVGRAESPGDANETLDNV